MTMGWISGKWHMRFRSVGRKSEGGCSVGGEVVAWRLFSRERVVMHLLAPPCEGMGDGTAERVRISGLTNSRCGCNDVGG